MTPRQMRRLEQKLARKAAKKHASAQQPATEQNPARNEVEQGEPSATTSTKAAVSQAKLAANRANSLLSSGPLSDLGREIVSQNAIKHGLTGTFFVLPGESQEDFDQLLAAYMESEEPVDQEETDMVKCMAEATWLSRRSVRLQDRCIVTIESGTPAEQKAAERQLALYLRYMTTHDRGYDRYANVLRKRRAERRKVERGFVSQKYREAAEARRAMNQSYKNELHELRQQSIVLRQQRFETNNRLFAAKAERLEIENQRKIRAQAMAAAA